MDDKAEKFLRRVLNRDTLPSLSPLALKLAQEAGKDDCSFTSLVEIINKDPGLSAKLLAMVNSPHYYRGVDITSIGRAVVTMGLKDLRLLTLSLSLKSALPATHRRLDFQLFWRTSLHRAVLARETAALVGYEDPEEAFVAGLINEIGLPLLLMALDGDELSGFPGFHRGLEDQLFWELSEFGVDHYLVGQKVLESWGVPGALLECQANPPLDETAGEIRLAHLADFARRAAESFFAPGVELIQIHQVAKTRFNLDPDRVNRMLVDSLNKVGDVADTLEIEMDRAADVDEILRKSEEALAGIKQQMLPHAKQTLERLSQGGQDKTCGLTGFKEPLMDLGGFVGRLARGLEMGSAQNTRLLEVVKETDRLHKVLKGITGSKDD